MKKTVTHAKCPHCKAEQNMYKDSDIWHSCISRLHGEYASESAVLKCKSCGKKMIISGRETIRYTAKKFEIKKAGI